MVVVVVAVVVMVVVVVVIGRYASGIARTVLTPLGDGYTGDNGNTDRYLSLWPVVVILAIALPIISEKPSNQWSATADMEMLHPAGLASGVVRHRKPRSD